MKEYQVGTNRYTTICSVHATIKDIFTQIKDIDPLLYESAYDLKKKIEEIMENGIELTEVAREMGQSMENSMRDNKEYHSYLNLSPQLSFIFPEEQTDE